MKLKQAASLFTRHNLPAVARILCATMLATLLGVCGTISMQGQTSTKPKNGRKVIVEVKPEYPAYLKSIHIEGIVRLKAVVTPEGKVSDVEIHGGNPILAENAVKAVKMWKYAPGPAQTDEEIVLNFGH